jgi:hypothetical protein
MKKMKNSSGDSELLCVMNDRPIFRTVIEPFRSLLAVIVRFSIQILKKPDQGNHSDC